MSARVVQTSIQWPRASPVSHRLRAIGLLIVRDESGAISSQRTVESIIDTRVWTSVTVLASIFRRSRSLIANDGRPSKLATLSARSHTFR